MGKVIMSGIVPPLVAPITGILASDLAVGSVVKLMENGVATEYLVVNQGKPSGSSLYDASCDGMWLLRKYVKETRPWHSSAVNDYQNSTIHAWLNGDFFNQFGSVEQAVIKQVRIPYVNGTGTGLVVSGGNGLVTKIFELSAPEAAYGTGDNHEYGTKNDGARVDYFQQGEQFKRISTLDNGDEADWQLRSPCSNTTDTFWYVGWNGYIIHNKATSRRGIRPALILPPNALFDTNTMLLKGVA